MAPSRRVVSVDLDALDLVGRDAPRLLSTSRAEEDSADKPRTAFGIGWDGQIDARRGFT